MATQPEPAVTSETPQGTNTGTNPDTVPLVQSQATPYTPTRRTGRITGFLTVPGGAAFGAGTRIDPPSRIAAPTVEPGAGATDDNPQDTGPNPTKTISYQDLITEWSIKPRANILDRYPSYTWQASVYMLTPDQANAYSENPRHRPNNYNLLFQSGGAARGTGTARGAQAGTVEALNQNTDNRNPFFTEDFYIDDVVFKTIAAGKGGNKVAHSTAELKFSVIEPSNITLIDRLAKATEDLCPIESNMLPNYASASYLMIIRFWAMDAQGNIVQVGEASPSNSQGALVEKYIPFTVRTISYTISGSLVKYDWDCAPSGLHVGTTTRWGTIRSDVELRGATVDDMLNGVAAVPYNEDVPGPNAQQELNAYLAQPSTGAITRFVDNRGGAATGAVRARRAYIAPKANASADNQGLMAYMNTQEQNDVRNGLRRVANEYVIQYSAEAEAMIKNATIRKPSDTVVKGATPTQKPVSEDTQSASPTKGGMSINTRVRVFPAGTQVLQAIEQVIRDSSYITDQANVEFDENSNIPRPRGKLKGSKPGFKWFNIVTTAEKLAGDDKINDYAYRITYTINVYNVAFLISPYFYQPAFPGLHKRYQYWFTGENVAVLDYRETFNYQYQITNSGSPNDESIKKQFDRTQTNSMVVIPYVTLAARSDASGQGANNRANDLAANAAENLYNITDLANSKMTIIGDPAWIMQGSILNSSTAAMYDSRGFNADGSINFDTQQVLYEILWQKPEDYDLSTGLADPYSRTEKLYKTRQALQSRVYQAITVTSEFRGGMFTQVIEGTSFPVNIDQQAIDEAEEFDKQTPPTEQTGAGGGSSKKDTTEQREFPGLFGQGYRRSAAPFVGGGGRSGGGGSSGEWTTDASPSADLLNSARMQNTEGGASALLVPAAARLSTLTPGTPTVAEMINNAIANATPTIQPAPAAMPVISNGLVVGAAQPPSGNTQPVLTSPQDMARET